MIFSFEYSDICEIWWRASLRIVWEGAVLTKYWVSSTGVTILKRLRVVPKLFPAFFLLPHSPQVYLTPFLRVFYVKSGIFRKLGAFWCQESHMFSDSSPPVLLVVQVTPRAFRGWSVVSGDKYHSCNEWFNNEILSFVAISCLATQCGSCSQHLSRVVCERGFARALGGNPGPWLWWGMLMFKVHFYWMVKVGFLAYNGRHFERYHLQRWN